MKRIKHSLFLSLMLVGLLLVATVAQGAVFTDLADDPNQQDILYLVERGLFTGADETSFQPQEIFTRGMAVTVLARQGQLGGSSENQFADTAPNAYYTPYVNWAAANGIVNGTSAATFSPNQGVTATELNTMMQHYLTWLGRNDHQELLAPGDTPLTRSQSAVAFAALDRFLTAKDSAILTHKAADGITLTGKLDLPATGEIKRLVLFINGSGPNTYDNRRTAGELDFNYYDLFANQLTARGAGFFRWNTRGVSVGNEPPLYAEIDEEIYKTYQPTTSVSDIGEWIAELRKNPRLQQAEIYLLGWSEGTIIAPLAAKAFPDEIEGLLLAGYCNDRLDEIFDWQQSGASSMVFYRQYFDYDQDGKISPQEFETDHYGIKPLLGENITFAEIDLNQDGYLTKEDFGLMLQDSKTAFYEAVAKDDDQWLKDHYPVQLTSGWFKGHQQLQPNRELLPTLDLPIAIFHGTSDQNCDVAGAYAIEKAFQQAGKTNLTVSIYQGHDHNLNYTNYPVTGAIPQAFEDLFQTCITMK